MSTTAEANPNPDPDPDPNPNPNPPQVTAASYTAAFVWAGVVCGARLYSGVSSPADVQGGMLVGGEPNPYP